MSLLPVELNRAEHPVDVVERLAAMREWSFDREDEDEISISVEGTLADYHVAFTWSISRCRIGAGSRFRRLWP